MKPNLIKLERIPNVAFERKEFLRLDKNENLVPFPETFLNKVRTAITADFISSYPVLASLYERIAKWLGCAKENIYITAGSDAAIKSVFEISVDPNDKILILHPTYAMYYVYSHMFQAKLLKVEYDKNFSLSVEQILKCIRKDKPKLICIANPNSPTGTVIPFEQLKEIIKTASKVSATILIDEAYYLYYPHSVAMLINKFQNLIVTRTFSKAFGFAAARLGFAIACKDMIANLQKVRPMYETNSFAVLLAKLVLDNFKFVRSSTKETLKGRRFLEDELDKMGLKYYNSFCNFLVIDVGSYKKSYEIVSFMKKHRILIGGAHKHPCLETCIRITAGPKKDMRLFLDKLRIFLKSN